jgi:hypothetical protein
MVMLVGNVLLILSAIPAVLSVLVYTRVDWRATHLGRHVMSYMTVIAAVLVLGAIRIFGFESWWFEWLRVIVYSGVPVVLWWRFFVVWKAQRDSGDELDPTVPERR